jgi:hypothetical protein
VAERENRKLGTFESWNNISIQLAFGEDKAFNREFDSIASIVRSIPLIIHLSLLSFVPRFRTSVRKMMVKHTQK